MTDEYVIETLADLFKIPPDKLGECLRQMEYAIHLHTLAVCDPPSDFSMVWRDDGDKSIDLSFNGENVLRLEITENEHD